MPVMYPFGFPTAKSCAIRFKTSDLATDALWALRSNGTIEYHGPEGEICKVRVVFGYDNRSLEQKTAEFQLRKMRSSIKYHQVPEKTWHTDWKNQKTWFLPEGNWAKTGMHCEVKSKVMEDGILKGYDCEVESMVEHQIPLEYHDRLAVARC